VVSPKTLKPNQQVEIVIDRYDVGLHTRAAIVWSSLELSQAGMTYRAGIAFADAHPEVLKLEAIAAAHAAWTELGGSRLAVRGGRLEVSG
jgi:hypothetical protein